MPMSRNDDWVEGRLAEVRREVAELEAIQRARGDSVHEHDWGVFDGSRHCFKCRRTEHDFAEKARP